MSKENFDLLDNEKTLNFNLDDSLGELPTMRLDQSGIGHVDRYELLEKLGEGGFGAVYGAKDTEAGILVALKALPAEICCDADEMAAIRDNFALVSRLHHPHIASLLHLHRVESVDEKAASALGVRSGDYLVVMEYAPGTTLFALRRAASDQTLPFSQAVEICRLIAGALDYAHSQRVLHRDIKPKNVMVALQPDNGGPLAEGGEKSLTTDTRQLTAANCTVKVLDFGLAAEIRSSMSRKSKDPQNSKSGTPLYMAPEQWEGKRQDGRADQYALAVLLYELVSGEVPFKSAFDSGNFEIMRTAVLGTGVEPILKLTKKQNAVLLRALSKRPEERFGSCGEFVEALAGGKFRPRNTRKRQSRSRKGVLAGLAVVGLLGIGVWFTKSAISNRQSAMEQAQLAAETQAEVAGLMHEAQTAFAAGDLDVATEKSLAVLKLAENYDDAKNLLMEVEKTAGERRAREVKVDAELAIEKLDQGIQDRGQGVGEKFDSLKKDLLVAKEAYVSKNWGQAFTEYKQVLAGCTELAQFQKRRQKAITLREEAERFRKNAQGAKADELGSPDWEQALQQCLSASEMYDAARFEDASIAWENATLHFQRLGNEARAMSDRDHAQAAYEKEWVSLAEDQRKMLDLYGGDPWLQVKALLSEAGSDDAVSAKAKYEKASRELRRAVELAEKNKRQADLSNTLVSAQDAESRGDWSACHDAAVMVLALDPNHDEGRRLKEIAEKHMPPPDLNEQIKQLEQRLFNDQGVDEFLKGLARENLIRWKAAAEQEIPDGLYICGIINEYGIGGNTNLEEAARFYLKAAQKGHAGAMSRIARLCQSGSGTPEDEAAAFDWYKKSAENGYVISMHQLGLCYRNGTGIGQDERQASGWFRRAAEAGYLPAMYYYGLVFENGEGVVQDYIEAEAWYRKAAKKGSARAMNNLAVLYYDAKGVAQNYAEAIHWYREAVEKGNVNAMYNLGIAYRDGHGIPADPVEAAKWIRKAAESGQRSAMRQIGFMYDEGKGVSQDYEAAIQWYQKAAEAGDHIAMNNLGVMYHDGKGVEKNPEKAVYWYRQAIAAGNAKAYDNVGKLLPDGKGDKALCQEFESWLRDYAAKGSAVARYNLGLAYLEGWGVGKNRKEAITWLETAANEGYAAAMFKLGLMYENGNEWGWGQDYKEALKWYRMAADKGDAGAMNNVGAFYANGTGVRKNDQVANDWFQKAARLGDATAQKNLRQRGVSW